MTTDDQSPAERGSVETLEGRVVYIMPNCSNAERGIPPYVLKSIGVIWASKWRLAAMAVALAIIGYGASYGVTPLYRADVTLVLADSRNGQSLASQLGQLGNIVGLAGMGLQTSSSAEPLAVLRSREFARQCIERHGLVESLAPIRTKSWFGAGGDLSPAARESAAIEYFQKRVFTVTDDRRSGLITLSVRWPDADGAAMLANSIAQQANELMRARTIRETSANVEFLKQELVATDMVALQEAISRLIEFDLQRLMLARSAEDGMFRVIDPARPAVRHYRPRRAWFALGAALFGTILFMALVLYRARSRLR